MATYQSRSGSNIQKSGFSGGNVAAKARRLVFLFRNFRKSERRESLIRD